MRGGVEEEPPTPLLEKGCSRPPRAGRTNEAAALSWSTAGPLLEHCWRPRARREGEKGFAARRRVKCAAMTCQPYVACLLQASCKRGKLAGVGRHAPRRATLHALQSCQHGQRSAVGAGMWGAGAAGRNTYIQPHAAPRGKGRATSRQRSGNPCEEGTDSRREGERGSSR